MINYQRVIKIFQYNEICFLINFSYKILYILILLSFFNIRAQQNFSAQNVDALIAQSEKEANQLNFSQSLKLNNQALTISKKIGYVHGIIKSKYRIALDLCDLGSHKESFEYMENMEIDYKDYIEKNPEFKFKLKTLTGRNYLALGFKKQAIKEFNRALNLSNSFTNDYKLASKIHALLNLSACYEENESDSAYFYLNKSMSLFKLRWPNRELAVSSDYNNDNTLFIHLILADYHMNYSNDLDSAFFYNSKTLEFSKKINSKYLYLVERQKAELLHKKENFIESLKYCFQSLEYVKEKKRIEDEIFLYKLIADNYRGLKDEKNELFYIDQHIKIKDSLAQTRREGIQISADRITAKEMKTETPNYFYTILIISTSLLLTIFLLFYLKKIKKAEKRISSKQKIISEKEDIIYQKEKENQKLKLKVNETFDEIIGLAKSNSQEFFTRFQEVYPNFTPKLLQIEPKIQTSELTFCAYIFLNFTTKDIANYTFTSPKTVQNRKNHIRKKLQIPSDKDIYIWMKEIMD